MKSTTRLRLGHILGRAVVAGFGAGDLTSPNLPKPGVLEGNVVIHTSDRIQPVVTVPIKGSVKQ